MDKRGFGLVEIIIVLVTLILLCVGFRRELVQALQWILGGIQR